MSGLLISPASFCVFLLTYLLHSTLAIVVVGTIAHRLRRKANPELRVLVWKMVVLLPLVTALAINVFDPPHFGFQFSVASSSPDVPRDVPDETSTAAAVMVSRSQSVSDRITKDTSRGSRLESAAQLGETSSTTAEITTALFNDGTDAKSKSDSSFIAGTFAALIRRVIALLSRCRISTLVNSSRYSKLELADEHRFANSRYCLGSTGIRTHFIPHSSGINASNDRDFIGFGFRRDLTQLMACCRDQADTKCNGWLASVGKLFKAEASVLIGLLATLTCATKAQGLLGSSPALSRSAVASNN